MRSFLIVLIVLFVSCEGSFLQLKTKIWINQTGKELKLKVSENGRYLVYSEGTPLHGNCITG